MVFVVADSKNHLGGFNNNNNNNNKNKKNKNQFYYLNSNSINFQWNQTRL